MEALVDIALKITPLYILVVLGYLAGKHFDFGATRASISGILIYLISPIVLFHGVILAPLDASLVLLPLFFFVLAVVISVVFYFVGKLIWAGSEKNLLAFI